MNPAITIARAELKKMFFSPVAWLVLIAFVFHLCAVFVNDLNLFSLIARRGAMQQLTLSFFATSDFGGKFFLYVISFFHLYVPLLSMNVFSREFSTGSVKLLFSSPISNWQIVTGKYLSLVCFGAIMVVLVAIPSTGLGLCIQHAEWLVIFNGLFGIFLLFCCYAAIALFMSSLTSYGIIAVIGTLGILTFLSFTSELGQETPVLRDIFYWLTLQGRSALFVRGLVSTESLLYFITVTGFFLALTWIRLSAAREQPGRGKVWGRYLLALIITGAIGYCSSLPSMIHYLDLTRSKINTLSEESQKIVQQLNGGLTITSYSNMLDNSTNRLGLPANYKTEMARYERYLRFKPDIRLNYKYYYHATADNYFHNQFPAKTTSQIVDTLKEMNEWEFDIAPYEAISKEADLAGEGFRFVSLIERENGRKTFLRVYDDSEPYPDEMQISAALKRLVQDLPVAGFVTGHGERDTDEGNERGYEQFTQKKSARYALINNGFDIEKIDLSAPVPGHIRILVLADLKEPLTPEEMINFRRYVNDGGNIVLAVEPGKDLTTGPLLNLFGVHTVPGLLIQPKEEIVAEVIVASASPHVDSLSFYLKGMSEDLAEGLVMQGAAGLNYDKANGFAVTELFGTKDSSTWNELETFKVAKEAPKFHPDAGEARQNYTTVLSLYRRQNNKEQKIIITGDADWMSNGELQQRREGVRPINFRFIYGMFHYLSDGELPIDTRKAPSIDNKLYVKKSTWDKLAPFVKWGSPGLVLICCVIVLMRRKGR